MKLESGMSYEEAVKVLGLKSGETVENYERAFAEVRKHMERLRDEADTVEKRSNYELELARFEEAIKVAEHHAPKKKKLAAGLVSLVVILAVIISGVIWGPSLVKNQAALKVVEARLPEAETAVSARNWTLAEEIYSDILEVDPKSPVALDGLETVEYERDVERRMQVSFALGKVQGLMDERRWDAAGVAMDKTLEMKPDDQQLLAFAARMEEERRVDDIIRISEDIEQARREEQWQVFVDKTAELAEADPENERLPEFRKEEKEAQLILAGLRDKASGIYEQALALDNGEYSLEALQLLRKAQRMAPSEKAEALLVKLSAYVQTISVPEDAKTIAEALELVRSGDKVLLGKGVYQGVVLVPAGVILEGVKGSTIIEGAAEDGSVLVVAGEGAAVRFIGLKIRHSGVSNAEERYPVVLVKNGQAIFDGCEISYGAGHGIAVIDGSRCEITATEVKGCGWDGIAVVGAGSEAVFQESRSIANLHHGLDVWDGGRVRVQRSRFQDNGLTGVLLTSKGAESRIESSSIERNREVGLVASTGVNAVVNGNLISGNLLGGVFATDEGTVLTLTANTIEKNGEVGLAVTKDVLLAKEEGNAMKENEGKQKWLNADFSEIKTKKILKALPVEE